MTIFVLLDWFDIIGLVNSLVIWVNKEGNTFSGFIFALVLGMLIAVGFMRYAMYRESKRITQLLKQKEEEINRLHEIIKEKISKITVPTVDETIVKRLVNYFSDKFKKKKKK